MLQNINDYKQYIYELQRVIEYITQVNKQTIEITSYYDIEFLSNRIIGILYITRILDTYQTNTFSLLNNNNLFKKEHIDKLKQIQKKYKWFRDKLIAHLDNKHIETTDFLKSKLKILEITNDELICDIESIIEIYKNYVNIDTK